MGTQIEKTKHHIVPDRQKSTRYVKNGKKRLVFFDFLLNIPSLTVEKRKNRCSPCSYWATAIFAVVTNYSNLFFSFTFFLDISHFTSGYELIIRSETTDFMKIICDSFPLI